MAEVTPLTCLYRLDPTTNKKTFSEEAVTACKVYMNNGDDGPLSKIFEHEYLQTLKRDLSIQYSSRYRDADEE